MKRRTVLACHAGTAATASLIRPARATTVGVTKTEIKIGSTTAFTVTGKAEDVVVCPIVNGIKSFPVSPPANPAAVPVVATTAPAS